MILAGKCKYAGIRSGEKDGKIWANITVDNFDDLVDRLEFFTRDLDIISFAKSLDSSAPVFITVNLTKNGGELRCHLEDLVIAK